MSRVVVRVLVALGGAAGLVAVAAGAAAAGANLNHTEPALGLRKEER